MTTRPEIARIVAANRFPVNPETLEFNLGGLATALGADAGVRWVGASDVSLLEPMQIGGVKCIPAIVDPYTYVAHYEGASNAVLWPAFHGLATEPMTAEWWQSYMGVNISFANAITKEVKLLDAPTGDTPIWVHDYQLFLLPQLLRQRDLGQPIGFFLHIPFPELAQMVTLLENGSLRRDHVEQIVSGILGADLIGFHIVEYTENFRQLVAHLDLGDVVATDTGFSVAGRNVAVAEFPIGIEPERYETAVEWLGQNYEMSSLRERFDPTDGRTLLVGVDRLDYTKGIDHRLQAFQQLLRQGLIDPAKVSLVQVATPNRENVAAYIDHKQLVESIVKEIHAEFGPEVLHFIDQSMPLDQLAAAAQLTGVARTFESNEWPYSDLSVVKLLCLADIALVTPVRDGMNLVAKEFVAAQTYGWRHGLLESVGSLILSDGAGAADELGSVAHMHKAGDIDDLAKQMLMAIRTSGESFAEQRLEAMNQLAQSVLIDTTVATWRQSFWSGLLESQDTVSS